MALEHKPKPRTQKPTGAKAAALRSRLSGEQRDVKKAIALQLSSLKRERDAWEAEARADEELLADATDLIARVESWATGATSGLLPTELLHQLRLFIGPQRCSACQGEPLCAVHREPEP